MVAQGEVPSFRDLTPGAAGPDVSQLESLLRALHFYNGPPDGKFTPAVARAVGAWHKANGLGLDVEVHEGDIVYLPSLPSRVALNASLISVGAIVSGGEAGITALSASPDFSMVLTQSQAALIPPMARVMLLPESGTKWNAEVGASVSDANGVTMRLRSTTAGPICASACDSVSITGTTLIPATVTTAPTVTGVTVPTAAILSDALNHAFVTDAKRTRHRVEVLGSSNGISVVSGIVSGLRVRVFTLADGQ